MRKRFFIIYAIFLIVSSLSANFAWGAGTRSTQPHSASIGATKPTVKKVLFIGDSMTGWMTERLNAYGAANGFEVAGIVWDGSTISKWGANSSRLSQLISQIKPEAIFVSLGLNDLAEKNPESRLGQSVAKIKNAAGDIPVLWVGPPTWPGKPWGQPLDNWLAEKMGAGHYYSSLPLTLARQSGTNPHPSRPGINHWIDSLMEWMPQHCAFQLPGYQKPTGIQFSRPKTFIYKKMKQTL